MKHYLYFLTIFNVLFLYIYFPIVVSCGTLANPANGQVGHTGITFEQTATYICNTGYILVGVNTRTCLATRVWSGSAPTCEGRSHNWVAYARVTQLVIIWPCLLPSWNIFLLSCSCLKAASNKKGIMLF